MIQEANVGVGIYGKEGNQAARASDFALRQFRHLQRLMAVHGRYSLVRNALLIHYSFYKNTAIFLVQIWFAFFCGFSARGIYDDWIMTFFNITITALPPLAIGVFEMDVRDEIIKEHPETYKRCQENHIFTVKTLFFWLLSAVYNSLVLFFGAYFLWGDGLMFGGSDQDGRILGLFAFGNLTMTVGILVIFLKLLLHANNWNWIVQASVFLSLLIYFVTVMVEGSFLHVFPDQYYVIFNLVTIPTTYLWIALGVVVCLLPDLLFMFLQRDFFPEDWQILQDQYKNAPAPAFDTYQKNYGAMYSEGDDGVINPDRPLLH